MSSFYTRNPDMALLDDTNGNTEGVHNASSDQAPGEVSISTVTGGSVVAALHSPSSDDLSQSLSEYTDADESISAPTELLAEFLSAIMIRDYVNALRYCKQILEYEPNNTTARDFYPHILSKIDAIQTHEQLSCESDENDNCNCNSPLGSSSSSSLRLSRFPSSSNDSESSSTESSFSSSVSSSVSSVSCLVSERIEEPDLVSMACSSEESDSRVSGVSLSESGLNINPQEGKITSKHAVAQHFLQSQSCRSLDVECDQLPTSVSENNTSQSYSSSILEEEEKDLTLSDLSNNDEEEIPKGDSTEKRSVYELNNQSALQTVSESLASNVSGSASVFASRLMTILRRKMIASRKEETPTNATQWLFFLRFV
ncbi:suppressor protein SRP40-like isoform X2 [Anopheles albimanus]|uniref:suppressor protein SRP40-like isoform X2 n=1 Tax=Anopheles albimanus TaxID=7167 RepID=UPI00163F041A|nr:suppressor protein SRP40-like isoform X2 [Anopheles albimanus]